MRPDSRRHAARDARRALSRAQVSAQPWIPANVTASAGSLFGLKIHSVAGLPFASSPVPQAFCSVTILAPFRLHVARRGAALTCANFPRQISYNGNHTARKRAKDYDAKRYPNRRQLWFGGADRNQGPGQDLPGG